jgi:PTH1 family peptidyl-tRNA hydrolase
MNGSGLAVVAALRGHVLQPADLIVVHDDLDLPAGRLKLRLGGSSGGHRGVASIIGELGRDGFVRVKIGIGRPPAGVDPVDFVLERPSPTEEKILSEAVLAVLREGLGEAMSRFNRTPDDTSAGGVVTC